MPSKPIIDPSQYWASHQRAPRGYGFWIFEFRSRGERVSQPNGAGAGAPVAGTWFDGMFGVSAPYGVAKAAAVAEARRTGAEVVVVKP